MQQLELNDPKTSSIIQVPETLNSNYSIIIYDSSGKELYTVENLSSEKHLLKREIFANSGLYFVEIKSKDTGSKLIKILVE